MISDFNPSHPLTRLAIFVRRGTTKMYTNYQSETVTYWPYIHVCHLFGFLGHLQLKSNIGLIQPTAKTYAGFALLEKE